RQNRYRDWQVRGREPAGRTGPRARGMGGAPWSRLNCAAFISLTSKANVTITLGVAVLAFGANPVHRNLWLPTIKPLRNAAHMNRDASSRWWFSTGQVKTTKRLRNRPARTGHHG